MSTEAQDVAESVERHRPKSSGSVMGAGVICLVLAQVMFGLGIIESMSCGAFRSANPGPPFLIGFAFGVLGLVWVILSSSAPSSELQSLLRIPYSVFCLII